MNYQVSYKHVGTVKEIKDRKDLTLVSDSQDVHEIADHIGLDRGEFGAYFVKVENGDYSEIYAIEGSVPYLHKRLYEIERIYA